MTSPPIVSLCLPLLLASPAFAQGTTRVNVDSAGAQGNAYAHDASLSADGRFVAFSSGATNLVPGDTNGVPDVFVHDRLTGKTSRVSVDSTGIQGNKNSIRPTISADGRRICFESSASNLVAGDTNGYTDIFVHDRATQQTTRVNVASGGLQSNWLSSVPSISANGRYVAFRSYADNLVPGDNNGTRDIFLHDLLTSQTTRISVDSSGIEGNDNSYFLSISFDGRYVAFESNSSNLVPGDTNQRPDIFVHDRMTQQTTRVSVDSLGAPVPGGSYYPVISANGRFVTFTSSSTDLVPGDINGAGDIFVHDQVTGQTTLVSVDSLGGQGDGFSHEPSISANGRWVSFESYATNLVPGDTNQVPDMFLHDRTTGETTRVSIDSAGGQGSDQSDGIASFSADGRYIAYSSDADNLIQGDTNGMEDVFVYDQFGPSLTKQGACPGLLEVRVSGSTVGQNVALLFGSAGAFIKPAPPCQGVELAIAQPTLGAILTTGSSGVATATMNAPAGACGLTIQAVDLATCKVTNPVVL